MVGALVSIGVALSPAAPAGAEGGQAQRYIVVLHDGAGDPGAVAAEHARGNGAQVSHVYRAALRGYAATMSPQAAARLAGDGRVRSVEPDQVVTLADHVAELPTGVDRIAAPTVHEQPAHLTVDGVDDVRVDVDVAVIDTGIAAHPDLNVAGRTDCSGGNPMKKSCTDGAGDDGNGHGTHVAGTIGALDNGADVVGVAPGARLWGVKVLSNSGSGYLSWIVAGIDWVTDDSKHPKIAVANMSLGCECTSSAMNTAIANSVAKGTTYVVAAGNSDKDASTFSPANHPDVVTVSALADFDGRSGGLGGPTCRTDQDDTLADFSNWGSSVEIAAPGVCILSTVPGGGLAAYSGTSMASPHVAGAAALVASRGVTTPAVVESTLVSEGNTVWTDDSGDGIREPLLDVSDTTVFTPVTVATPAGDGGGGGDGGTTPQAPVASFTYSCGGNTTCSFDGSSSSDPDGGAIATYAWTATGQDPQTGAVVTYAFPAASGSYVVTLTVTDNEGAEASASATVTCDKRGKNYKCS